MLSLLLEVLGLLTFVVAATATSVVEGGEEVLPAAVCNCEGVKKCIGSRCENSLSIILHKQKAKNKQEKITTKQFKN